MLKYVFSPFLLGGYNESVNAHFILRKIVQCQQEMNFKYNFGSLILFKRSHFQQINVNECL